ncbi:hypothetical protein TYRP_004975 [Tyrophagus putrescentiae]|nr:hypothetical protein TYRP_004975 [Tyrophagus putrescentiae]
MYQNTAHLHHQPLPRPLVPVRVAPPRPSLSNQASRTFQTGAQPQLPKLPPEREAFISDQQQKTAAKKPKRRSCPHRIELYIVPPVVALAVIIFLALLFYQFVYKASDDEFQLWPNSTSTQSSSASSFTSTTEVPLTEMGKRRAYVRRMAREAWAAYASHALGADALKPLSHEPFTDFFGANGGLGVGLKEEYEVARSWTERRLNFSAISKAVDVQHSVNYFIGGLLSAYALTGDGLFLNRSIAIADVLDPAYRSRTGLPYWKLRPSVGEPSLKTPFLSTIGGQHLEYLYLSFLSGNLSYSLRAEKIRHFLTRSPALHHPLEHLYMHQVDVERGVFTTAQATLFTASRAFFSNLLLSYIQTNRKDQQALQQYVTALGAAHLNGLFKVSASPLAGLLYIRNFNLNTNFHRYDKYMNVDGCVWGGLLALGAEVMPAEYISERERHREWARQLANTCQVMANQTATRLAPYRFYFDYRDEEEVNMADSGRFVLSPELPFTYFLLYRITKEELYRDLAWRLAQAIHTHCRAVQYKSAGGYTRIRDVYETPTEKGNYQDVDFLAATLKYLYLTFQEEEKEQTTSTSSPSTFLSLDEWVFNERGQPLPICGQNAAYNDKLCR